MATYFSSIIENAIRLANYWHQGQLRRGGEFDYYTHPVAVASLLARSQFDDIVVSAGLCHDLLLFTKCPEDEIASACGSEVLAIVAALTEDKTIDLKLQWKERKQKYIESVRQSSWNCKAVCVAERIHNVQTLLESVQEFGLRYFENFYVGPEEKLWFEDHVCIMLQDTWEHPLVDEYDYLVNSFVELLEKLDEQPHDDSDTQPEYKPVSSPVDYDDPEIAKEKRSTLSYVAASSSNENQKVEDTNKNGEDGELIVAPSLLTNSYLNDDERGLVFPAALQLGISKGELTNPLLQETLKINYLLAFRLLKEMKRLHIIKRADSFKPRKINIIKAKEILKQLTSTV